MAEPLDLVRIRRGEPKYMLTEVFDQLFPSMHAPAKVPFARPMEQWLAAWPGPKRPEFLPALDVAQFTGEQRWLLYCLDRFMTTLSE